MSDEQSKYWIYKISGEEELFALRHANPINHYDAARLASEDYFLYRGQRAFVEEGEDIEIMVRCPEGKTSFHTVRWEEEILCRSNAVIPGTDFYQRVAQRFGVSREVAKKVTLARSYGGGREIVEQMLGELNER
jgi:hypothetical protein